MSWRTRLRIALGFIQEGDPHAWQCLLCHRWTDANRCSNGVQRLRVNRPPEGPPPPFHPSQLPPKAPRP